MMRRGLRAYPLGTMLGGSRLHVRGRETSPVAKFEFLGFQLASF